MQRIDLTGKRFGKVIVISLAEVKDHSLWWNCKCDCGNIKVCNGDRMKRGLLKSCGCLSKIRGGFSNSENKGTYKAWASMIGRCYNENYENFPNYGGRGIKVCDRWLGENGFFNFLDDMGLRPSNKHSLDRFPNNSTGWYEKDNCRWATTKEQCRNVRTNRWFEYEGKRMIVQDWAEELGISRSKVYTMMSKHEK